MYVCTYMCTCVYMYICMHTWMHDTFLLDVCSCRRWVWLRLLPPNVRQVCGDKSPPSLPRPSFLFHLLISVLNTSDGLGGNMTHSGCSSSLQGVFSKLYRTAICFKTVLVFSFVFCLYAILLIRSPTGNCGVGLVHSKETLTNITWSHSESKFYQRVVNGTMNCSCGNFELSSYLFSDYSQSSVEVRPEWKSCCFFYLMCYCPFF